MGNPDEAQIEGYKIIISLLKREDSDEDFHSPTPERGIRSIFFKIKV